MTMTNTTTDHSYQSLYDDLLLSEPDALFAGLDEDGTLFVSVGDLRRMVRVVLAAIAFRRKVDVGYRSVVEQKDLWKAIDDLDSGSERI